MRVRIESKSQSSISANSTLEVLMSNINNINSFAYDSSHTSPLVCFTPNSDENEETIPKELIKAMEG